MSEQEEELPIHQQQPLQVQAKPAPKSAEEWHAYGLRSQQEEVGRLEDAAKFLAGMSSISFTIFIKSSPEFMATLPKVLQGVVALIWFLSLIASFWVLFPQKYRYHHQSAESIQKMHQRAVKHKTRYLYIATATFLLALFLMGGMYLRFLG